MHAVAEPDGDPGWRSMSNSSARSKARGSRVAAPVMRSTGKPAGTVPPSSSRSSTQNRPWYCDGGQYRRISSTARDLLVVVDNLLPLVGVLPEEHDRVADELRDGLGTRAAEERHETRDLDVVEAGLHAVTAVDGDLREAREHVVAGVLALLDGQLVEVHGRLEHRLLVLGARRDLARLPAEAGVEPVADLLALAVGHAEHARDHLDREGRGEVGDRVELGRVVHRIEEAPDHLADHRFERRDGTRREHPTHERSEAVVLRRIHHDEAPEALDLLRVHREREELDAVRAREPLPVSVRRQDVGEARQRVEPVPLAEVHGCFVAQAPVHVVGVVEELLGERIELDGSRRRGHVLSLACGRGATVTEGIDRLAPLRRTASTTAISSSTAISEPLMSPRVIQPGAISAASSGSQPSLK